MAIRNKRMALVCAGLAMCNVLVAVAAQAQDVSFEEAQNFGAGNGPLSVAVGDFNGDGLPDLAVANALSQDVSVLLGNGDGTFQVAQNFAAGFGPCSVAVGDFNRDGWQDLVVAYRGSVRTFVPGGVSVLLGNGDGSFQAALNFAVGSLSTSVAVGEFNGDKVLDLAVANADSNDVLVLLGNGDGSFQTARNFAAWNSPYSVAVGDFNRDGWQDLAVAIYPANVSVLLGNGDGSFLAAQIFGAGNGAVSVGVGDFNGDGLPDLAVPNNRSANVSVLINNTPQ